MIKRKVLNHTYALKLIRENRDLNPETIAELFLCKNGARPLSVKAWHLRAHAFRRDGALSVLRLSPQKREQPCYSGIKIVRFSGGFTLVPAGRSMAAIADRYRPLFGCNKEGY